MLFVLQVVFYGRYFTASRQSTSLTDGDSQWYQCSITSKFIVFYMRGSSGERGVQTPLVNHKFIYVSVKYWYTPL